MSGPFNSPFGGSPGEPRLGNPATDDLILSSKADGTRSWIEPPEAASAEISTGDATNIAGLTFDVPVTVSAFGYTDKDALRVGVDYRETGATTWTRTALTEANALTAYTITVSGLTIDTAYEFRAVATDVLNPDMEVVGATKTATTLNIFVSTPTLTVEGDPDEVPEQPTLTTTAFATSPADEDTHQDTDWQILDGTSTVVWESLADASNKTSITVPADTLAENTQYTFRVRHRGTTYGESAWASVVATTIEVFDMYTDDFIGEAREGGFFAGRMNPDGGNLRYAVITAPKASGESADTLTWKEDQTETPGTRAIAAEGYTWAHWDGERNTRICTLNAKTHAAADYCAGLTIAEKADWHLPAADELELQYRNFKPDDTANNTSSRALHGQSSGFNPNSEPRKPVYTAGDPPQTVLTAYQTGGSEVFQDAQHWSSSETASTNAWYQGFGNGDQNNSNKSTAYRVRAIRRHWLYPFPGANFGDLITAQGGYWGGNIWDGVRTSVLGDTLTSTTELAVGTGTKTLTVAGTDALTPTLWVGRKLRFVATGRDRSNAAWMTGAITAIDTDTREVTISCTHTLGSGTFSSWALVAGQALIVSPKSWGDVGTFAWKDANTAGPVETQTLTNGPAATAAMIALGGTTYPAAAQIAAMNDYDSGTGRGGFADWYMPSRDELHVIGYTLCPTAAGWTRNTERTADVTYSRDGNVNDSSYTEQTNWHSDPIVAVSAFVPQTHKDVFKVGGDQCFEATNYWPSSEFSATFAWAQNFDSGAQNGTSKTGAFRVRAIRRVAI